MDLAMTWLAIAICIVEELVILLILLCALIGIGYFSWDWHRWEVLKKR